MIWTTTLIGFVIGAMFGALKAEQAIYKARVTAWQAEVRELKTIRTALDVWTLVDERDATIAELHDELKSMRGRDNDGTD